MEERKKGFSALLVMVLLLNGFNSVSAASPASEFIFIFLLLFPLTVSLISLFLAELVSGFISNALSAIFKLLWSMTSTPKTGIDFVWFFAALGIKSWDFDLISVL